MFWYISLSLLFAGLAYALRRTRARAAALAEELRNARRQRKEVTDFLGLFTTSLATVNDIARAMELVASYLRDVLEADSLCIFRLIEEEGQQRLQAVAVAGMFPPLQRTSNMVMVKASYLREHLKRERITVGDGILGRAARDQQSLLIEDAAQLPELERLPRDVRTLMVVPMVIEGHMGGVVCAVNCKDPDRHFTASDLDNLERLSNQAAFASNIIQIYAERSTQERLIQELSLAQRIQNSLLPDEIPNFGDFRMAAFSRSALEVGGDFYDFIPIDENRLMVIVADASGKGVPACMLMAMCQSFARSAVEHFTMLENFLLDMNRYLYRDTDRGHFVTMGVLVLDRENNTCEYARAGHTELLVRAEDGVTRTIKPKGPALGMLPEDMGVAFATLAFAFTPGSSLMLFTDGISEALDADGHEFGLERLAQIWREHDLPQKELADIILADVNAFTGSEPQADDQTILILQRPRSA